MRDHPHTRVGALFQASRIALNLNPHQLAERLGYAPQRLAHGANQILAIEAGRLTAKHAQLAERLVQSLGIDPSELEQARRADEAEARRQWRAWVNQPIAPRLEVQHGQHWFSVVSVALEAAPDAELEQHAGEVARREQKPVRLVLSRRQSVSFASDGQVTARSWTRYPEQDSGPYLQWRGRRVAWPPRAIPQEHRP